MNESTRAVPRALTWGRILRIFAFYVFVPVILVGLGLWFYSTWQARADLDREIAWVRARNEPLSSSELNEYYTPAPTRPNMTAELETALELVESLAKKPEVSNLPFIGLSSPNDISSAGETWIDELIARAFIADLQPAFDCFRTAAQNNATARYSIEFGKPIDLQKANRIRNAVRALQLATRVHARNKNFDAAIEAIKSEIALGNTLDREPLGIAQIVRCAVYGMVLGEIEELSKNHVLTDDQLAELQTATTSFDLKNAFNLVVAGERAFGYSVAVARRWTMVPVENAVQSPQDQLSKKEPFWIRDAQQYLLIMRRAAEANEKSLVELKNELKAIDDEFKSLKSPAMMVSYLTTVQSIPVLHMISKTIGDRSVNQAVTGSSIAVIRFRKKYRKLPARLADLVPEFLPAVPLDPSTGTPIDYLVDGDSAQISGQSFVFDVNKK